MRRWALIQNGIITRIVDAVDNPFHPELRVLDVTRMDAAIGYTVDANGTARPGAPMAEADVSEMKREMLRSETMFQILRGVWLPAGQRDGALFDTHHEALASLAAMAAAGGTHVPALDGSLKEIAASDVFSAAGNFIGDCYAYEAEVETALGRDPMTDIQVGWPDNGEPVEVAAAQADEPAQSHQVAEA